MPRSTGARSSSRAGASADVAVPAREGALPGGGSVPRFRTAYLRTDRRSARVLSESVYDPTLRHPLARSLVGGDHPVATILGRSHPGSGQILASGRLARHSSTGAPSRCCLPARQGDCSPAVCAQTCGSLVRNDPRACAYAVEMLGIPLPVPHPDRNLTWESASRTLCIQRKTELSTCHAAIDNKLAERLS